MKKLTKYSTLANQISSAMKRSKTKVIKLSIKNKEVQKLKATCCASTTERDIVRRACADCEEIATTYRTKFNKDDSYVTVFLLDTNATTDIVQDATQVIAEVNQETTEEVQDEKIE